MKMTNVMFNIKKTVHYAGTMQTACLLHQYARNVDHIHADNR